LWCKSIRNCTFNKKIGFFPRGWLFLVDSDELIFYAEGNFFSRKGAGIARGALSLHPAGHIHGPHPGAVEGSLTRIGQRTEEVAVMLDTFQPLQMAASAVALEDARYVHSWHGDSHA
jgi:homogentisate 1,2-dioxygenase